MDTRLGVIGVSTKQIQNAKHLFTNNVVGFGAVGEDIVVVHHTELTDKEKTDLIAALKLCPEVDPVEDEKVKAFDRAVNKILTSAKLTPEEEAAFKEKNATKK